jgi:hypothetical protein
MLKREMKVKIVMKIVGICQPAFRNRKGFVMAQTGLGCRPIPLAKFPRGNAGRTPKEKNTIAINNNRTLLFVHAFARSPAPSTQKIAEIQTRGKSKTSKNPIDLLPPPPSPHAKLAIESDSAAATKSRPNCL